MPHAPQLIGCNDIVIPALTSEKILCRLIMYYFFQCSGCFWGFVHLIQGSSRFMYLSIENSKSKSIYMGSELGNILLEENSNYLSQTTNETLSKKRKWSSIQRGKRKKSIILMD